MIGQYGLVQRAHLRIALLLRELAQAVDVTGGGAPQITVRCDGDLLSVIVTGLGIAEPGSSATGRGDADGDDPCETQGDHFSCVFHFAVCPEQTGDLRSAAQRHGVAAPGLQRVWSNRPLRNTHRRSGTQ
jgi:hypothetical protein